MEERPVRQRTSTSLINFCRSKFPWTVTFWPILVKFPAELCVLLCSGRRPWRRSCHWWRKMRGIRRTGRDRTATSSRTSCSTAISLWALWAPKHFGFVVFSLWFFDLCYLIIWERCTVSHTAGSYQHVGGWYHQWVALASIPDDQDVYGIIHVENKLPRTLHSSPNRFTNNYTVYLYGFLTHFENYFSQSPSASGWP